MSSPSKRNRDGNLEPLKSNVVREVTRGHIKLEIDGKTVIVYGEGLVRAKDQPDYVVYKNSIKTWESPFNDEPFSAQDYDRVIDALNEWATQSKIRLVFE